MSTKFNQMVRDLVGDGVSTIDDLSDRDKRRLTAVYLKEAEKIEQWEFITEPPACEKLPELLIDLLESRRNGTFSFYAPEITLAITMATAAIHWCMDNIEEAIEDAVSERKAAQRFDHRKGYSHYSEDLDYGY